MSVFARAFEMATERKMALSPDGEAVIIEPQRFGLLVSGFDLTPKEVAEYLEVVAQVYIMEMIHQKDPYEVLRGVAADGLLLGLMVGKALEERK